MSTEYAEAFKIGIEAAKSLERDRVGVDATIRELSRTIVAASSNRIASIELHVISRYDDRFEKGLVAVASPTPDGAVHSETLAGIEISGSGYPVTVGYDGTDYVCHDLPSFKAALIKLLEDPATGHRILRLINAQSETP
jgi:hypothetical protein